MDRRTYLGWAAGTIVLAGSTRGAADEHTDDESESSDEDEILSVSNLDELQELPFEANVVTELEGEGSRVPDAFELNAGLAMLVYESENVDDAGIEADIEQVDGDDEEIWAINEVVFMGTDIDEVSGATLVQVEGGEYLIDIATDGAWEIHVVQLEAPAEEVRLPPVVASGEHSTVVGPVEADGD